MNERSDIYKNIFRYSTEGFIVVSNQLNTDGNYDILDINRSATSAFAIDSELIHKHDTSIFQNLIPDINQLIQKYFEIRSIKHEFYNNYSGRFYSLQISRLDEAKLLMIVSDITQLRLLHQEIYNQNHKFDTMFDSGNQSTILLDKKHKIESFNSNANYNSMIITGKRLKKGDNLIEFFPDEYSKEVLTYFENALAGKSIKFDKNIPYDPKIDNWFEIYIEPVKKNNEIKNVILIANPINDRKRSENEMKSLITALKLANKLTDDNSKNIIALNEELEKSEKELRILNESKDKFFSIIAHDLRSPFQGFLSLTKELVNNFDVFDSEELNSMAIEMNESANHLYKLLENLLQWSRIQRGIIDFNPLDLHLNQVLDLNFGLIKNNAKLKNIELINNINEDVNIYADVNMLNTIIRNLISNAIKFTPEGGKIIVDVNKINNMYEISISDTGVGIPKEKLSGIFDIDKSKSTPGTNNESGTGLGLTLCKELVEKNGGKIDVESIVGKGTRFFFTMHPGETIN